jgi:hypothetical protein
MMRFLLTFGLILSIIFDAAQLWFSEPNWVLSGISGITLFISALGLVVTVLGEDEPLELKWAVLYTFPMALLVLASVVRRDELTDKILDQHQLGFTLPHVLLGRSQDYIDAFWSHFASLSIPIMTVATGLLLAWAYQWIEHLRKRGGL